MYFIVENGVFFFSTKLVDKLLTLTHVTSITLPTESQF